jgi:GT2 family glycosyltransferase
MNLLEPNPSESGVKSILAVIVLYKVPAEQSASFQSMRHLLASDPQVAAAVDWIVCDNTPYEQPRPPAFDDLYSRDPTNPGLAKCYNLALREAQSRKIPWLMVLDQDTTVTAEYLQEALAVARNLLDRTDAVAIVPRLANRGNVCSPHYVPFMGPARPIDPGVVGIAPDPLCVFNSGAILRVNALETIGGFPAEYPLDYLDHATFTPLQKAGGKLYILRSTLSHDLSTNDHGRHIPELVPRQIGILDAEFRYYRQYGSAWERALRRLRLLRAAAGRTAKGENWEQTWRILKSAFRT